MSHKPEQKYIPENRFEPWKPLEDVLIFNKANFMSERVVAQIICNKAGIGIQDVKQYTILKTNRIIHKILRESRK